MYIHVYHYILNSSWLDTRPIPTNLIIRFLETKSVIGFLDIAKYNLAGNTCLSKVVDV